MIPIRNSASPAAFTQVQPLLAIEQDKLIFKDGRIAVGFLLSGTENEHLTGNQYAALSRDFCAALRSLPVGAIVQKTDVYFEQPFRVSSPDQPYFTGKLLTHFLERPVLFHRSYLFIGFSPMGWIRTSAMNSLFARWGRSLLTDPLRQINERLSVAETTATELAQNLQAAGTLGLTRLTYEELLSLQAQYFALDFAAEKPAGREITQHLSGLSVGEKVVNVVSLAGQGSSVFPNTKSSRGVDSPMTFPLTSQLPFPHILSQVLLIEDTEKALKSLDTERKLNDSLSFLATQDNLLKAEELEAFTAEVRAENKQLVSLHVSVTLFSDSEKWQRERIEQTTSAFRSLSGAEALVESYDTAGLFFALLPGNAHQLPGRWLRLSADQAACYLHFTTDYFADKTGDLFCDRQGNPLRVNLFNTALNNQNSLTIGPSGSGKSYTMGYLLTQRFERGARQIILDVGGTYRNVMESLVGLESYFEYDPAHPMAFNPFLLQQQDGKYLLTGDKVNFLVALIAVLWKGGEAKKPLSPAERAVLVQLIPAYYTQLTGAELPSLRSFYQWLQAKDHRESSEETWQKQTRFFDVTQLLIVLAPFVEGAYASVLNAEREVDISDYPLVCFDLARVKSDPALYPVVSMLITELSLDQIRKFPDAVKYLYLDEAWSMLSEAMGEWIETMFRTIRKNNGSIGIITQGVDEIVHSSVGAAILANAQTQIILNHSDTTQIDKLARHLGFTDHEVDKIKSLRKSKNYRELFIKQGEVGKVYWLEACPHLDAVLSSKPVERNYLRKLLARFEGNLRFAASQYVEDKALRKGVFAN